MRVRSYLLSISMMVIFLLGTFDAEAQKKKRRPTKEREETTERSTTMNTGGFGENMSYQILIGNLSFGQQFVFSPKFQAEYKILDNLSAGALVKMNYIFQNNVGANDASLLDYAFGPLARYSIGETFYLQTEYNFYSFDLGDFSPRATESGFLAGVGYMSGFGDWKFGLQLMFVLDNDIRDTSIFNDLVEYYFGAVYNF